MDNIKWTIRAREFVNCNCDYGCPCQFNTMPTHGHCQAVVGVQIDEGFHGDTRLDGLKFAGIFVWPGAIHEGHGQAALVIDERATQAQREALLRILSGQDTEPGATIFQVFSTTLERVYDPVFAAIDFDVDVDARKAQLAVSGILKGRGEPILNPVTGAEHRARIDIVGGFEYDIAEIGRGWSSASHELRFDLANTHSHFARIHLSQNGIVH